jgi:hypothetical protein
MVAMRRRVLPQRAIKDKGRSAAGRIEATRASDRVAVKAGAGHDQENHSGKPFHQSWLLLHNKGNALKKYHNNPIERLDFAFRLSA